MTRRAGNFIAFSLSNLRRGKQLQLWDSNVHNNTTQQSRLLQVLTNCHY